MNILLPNKQDIMLGMAVVISQLSKDIQTKCGCVIVNPKWHILGCGYNSFAHGFKDDELPNTRPDKYPWMIHSEVNAISFCQKQDEMIAYISMHPCHSCLQHMWQNGIKKVVCINRIPKMVVEQKELINKLLSMVPMELVLVEPDFSFFKNIIENYHEFIK